MRTIDTTLVGALALAMLAAPGAALADDPLDLTMQTPEALARDRAMIRLLNQDMLEQVRARDAAYAQGWQDYRRFKEGSHPAQIAYKRDMAEYESAQARYAEDRRRYEQAMEHWRAAR